MQLSVHSAAGRSLCGAPWRPRLPLLQPLHPPRHQARKHFSDLRYRQIYSFQSFHKLRKHLGGVYTKNAATRAALSNRAGNYGSVLFFIHDLVRGNPRHHGAQLLAHSLDLVGRVLATTSSHGRIVQGTFRDEHLGVFTTLDALQCVTHGFAGLLVDHLRAGYVLAVLSVVGDGVVHVGDAAFVHQVNNQLQLVQTLKVRHFQSVARFGQGFETGFNQLNRATTQNRLLTEQVGFSFIFEGGFDDTGTAAADAAGVGQGYVLGVAGSVLEDRDQIRNTAALGELGAYSVARRLRSNHDHVQVFARNDLVVVDSKTVSERQGSALLQVRLDFVAVQLGLELVRSQHYNNVGGSNGRSHVAGLQAVGFSLGDGGRAGTQTNHYVYTGVLQVARVRVALGAEAQNGNFLALDDGKITILIVINLHEKPLLSVTALRGHSVQIFRPALTG